MSETSQLGNLGDPRVQAPTDFPILSKSVSSGSQNGAHSHHKHHHIHHARHLAHPDLERNGDTGTAAPIAESNEGGEGGSTEKDRGGEEEEAEYPEGGREAWIVVFGSFVSMVASFGIMNTLGTLQAHLAKDQLRNHTEGEIGWIFGVYSFLSFFGGIQIGPIFDAYGPRWLLMAGTFCIVVGMMLTSISVEYWQFMLCFGVLTGLGTSLIFTPAVASVGHWFLRNRAYATGVATTGGSIGGIMFPLIINAAIPAVGFGWAIRIVGFIALVLLLAGNCLIRARTDIINGTAPSSSNGSVASGKAPSLDGKKRSAFSAVRIDLTAFKDPRFALTTMGVFMIEWAVFIPITYITSYALAEGLPSKLSYELLAVLNVGSVFGRWLPGLVADRVGRFNIMIITICFCMTTVLGLWLPATYVANIAGRKAILIVFCLLYGFGSGSGISLTPVCVGQICTTREYGTKYGTCYFFVSFATLTGIPIAGQIMAASGSYAGIIYFTAAAYIGAFVFFGSARYACGARTWRAKY